MVVLGILGGIACGKSLVCDQFKQLGAIVIAADPMGHDVLRDEVVRRTLVDRWGEGVLADDGSVDRARVARIVFGAGPAARRERDFLEQQVHPRIEARIRERLDDIRRNSPDAVVLLDAALLVEAGWTSLCDEIVFVEARDEVRRERAVARGWSVDDWRAREAAQVSLTKKRELSRWTLDNSGPTTETYRQVQELWNRLRLAE